MPRREMSLLELVTALAVLMILTALAIPSIADSQARARKSEVATNVDGMYTAELAYFTSADTWYTTAGFQPDALPGKSIRDWAGIPAIGFQPDSGVRGSYAIVPKLQVHCYPTSTTSQLCPDTVCATGMTDLDTDGKRSCLFVTPTSATGTWINADAY